MWPKHSAHGIAFGLILITATGCGSGSGGSFCAVYQPVYTTEEEREVLRERTEDTIDGNNAAWLELGCEGE